MKNLEARIWRSAGFQLEALESRVLLSGDPLGLTVSAAAPHDPLLPSTPTTMEEQPFAAAADAPGLAGDSSAQIGDIFADVAAAPLTVTDDLKAAAGGSAGDLGPASPASGADSPVQIEVSAVPATVLSLGPESTGAQPGQNEPGLPAETLSLADQLTLTLRTANGPPALSAASPANAGPEYVDPDILANPKQAILEGLTALGNWANSLDAFDKIALNLPIIGRNLGQMLDMGGILLSYLRDPVNNYFSTDATPTTDELLVALQNLDTTVGGLSITVADGTVTGGLLGGNEFRFNLVFQASRTVTGIPINLGPNGSGPNLKVPAAASATVDADLSLNFNFAFGLRNLAETAPGSGQYDLTLICVSTGSACNDSPGGFLNLPGRRRREETSTG